MVFTSADAYNGCTGFRPGDCGLSSSPNDVMDIFGLNDKHEDSGLHDKCDNDGRGHTNDKQRKASTKPYLNCDDLSLWHMDSTAGNLKGPTISQLRASDLSEEDVPAELTRSTSRGLGNKEEIQCKELKAQIAVSSDPEVWPSLPTGTKAATISDDQFRRCRRDIAEDEDWEMLACFKISADHEDEIEEWEMVVPQPVKQPTSSYLEAAQAVATWPLESRAARGSGESPTTHPASGGGRQEKAAQDRRSRKGLSNAKSARQQQGEVIAPENVAVGEADFQYSKRSKKNRQKKRSLAKKEVALSQDAMI